MPLVVRIPFARHGGGSILLLPSFLNHFHVSLELLYQNQIQKQINCSLELKFNFQSTGGINPHGKSRGNKIGGNMYMFARTYRLRFTVKDEGRKGGNGNAQQFCKVVGGRQDDLLCGNGGDGLSASHSEASAVPYAVLFISHHAQIPS